MTLGCQTCEKQPLSRVSALGVGGGVGGGVGDLP